MFDSVRTRVTDTAAPALDALSWPLGAAGSAVDRVRGVFAMYQDNLRLERENDRLLQWEQGALKLTADNRQLRGVVKAGPRKAGFFFTPRGIAQFRGGDV